jgi:hypothetical protein
MIKTLTRPDGRTVRFGRRRPVVAFPRLRLKDYIIGGPTLPATCSYASSAAQALAQMYLNDTLGDCVIAAVGHVEGVMTGAANPPDLVYTNAQITALYSGACGYVPGDPATDQGCDIQTVLTFWEQQGAPIGSAHKPVGYMSVDPANWVECQTAIWLFLNLVYGVDLPDAWVNPVPSSSGFIWDVAGPPDPNNGHCFPALGYNATQALISTWAMTGWITQAATAEYAAPNVHGELYTVLSQDTISQASQLCPAGINWAQLQADFAALVPSPPLPPSPPPSDVGSPAWLEQNLSSSAWQQFVAAVAAQIGEGIK